MKRTRVAIENLVLCGSGLPPTAGPDLGRMVKTNLERLLIQRGAPAQSQRADVVRLQDPASAASSAQRAQAIANAVYCSWQRKG